MTKMYKKLSVLIPVYNEEKTIDKCIEKVLNAKIFDMNLEVIVSDKRFKKMNTWLEKNGFLVEKISYQNVSKMSGLLRCSTLPLLRE